MRCVVMTVLVSAALAASASTASAQVGAGARMAWVKADSQANVDSVRFIGGQIRLLSKRVGLEVALDHHSEEFPLANQKVTEMPLQMSLLLRMGTGKVTPFLLGGPGWYRHKVSVIDGSTDADLVTTEFGWHAGVGLEVFAGRHFGMHGDYRYTFLDFNGDNNNSGFVSRLLPGHRGSMWTLGASVYF